MHILYHEKYDYAMKLQFVLAPIVISNISTIMRMYNYSVVIKTVAIIILMDIIIL